jgi:glycerol uptake facilitator-like aquaporin
MKKKLLFTLLTLIILAGPCLAMAQPVPTNLIDDAAVGAGYDPAAGTESTIPQTVGTIIQIILSFVGTIFFVLIIVSGLQWMTAGGSEEKVTQARTRITNATIGLGITIIAYFITWFISAAILGT